MNQLREFFTNWFSNNNTPAINVIPNNEEEGHVEVAEVAVKIEKVKKQATEKHCGFCKETGHNIRNCETLHNALDNITDYCSSCRNQTNLPKVRMYLSEFDKAVINRYISKYNISNYMYHHCSVYYDNHIRSIKTRFLKNVELIIGYLCVLPLHPEIKIKRQSRKNANTGNKNNRQNYNVNDYYMPHLFMTTQGLSVGYGIRLF